jgi:hypothetical protein
MGPSNFIALSVFAALGVVGYVWARSFRSRYGRNPLNTGPLFWGLCCGLVTLIGFIALAVAEIKASKEPRAATFGTPAPVPPRGAPTTAPKATASGWSAGDTILPG